MKMIWTHKSGKKETVLFIGASVKPATPGFNNTIYACVMTAENNYTICPITELSLTTEDYNKIFAE